ANGVEDATGIDNGDLDAVNLNMLGGAVGDLIDGGHANEAHDGLPAESGCVPWPPATATPWGSRPLSSASIAPWIRPRTSSTAIRSITGWKKPCTSAFWASSGEKPRLWR